MHLRPLHLEGRRAMWVVSTAAAMTLLGAQTMCTIVDGEVADPDPPATADNAYFSFDEAARICSLVAECRGLSFSFASSYGIPMPPQNYSTCLEWLSGPLARTGAQLRVQREGLRRLLEA